MRPFRKLSAGEPSSRPAPHSTALPMTHDGHLTAPSLTPLEELPVLVSTAMGPSPNTVWACRGQWRSIKLWREECELKSLPAQPRTVAS